MSNGHKFETAGALLSEVSVDCVCKKKSTTTINIPGETIQPHHLDFLHYHRSGNFHVKKLLYDKLSSEKIFVGTTPYRISVNSQCMLIFARLIFVATIDYENMFTTKISRLTVLHFLYLAYIILSSTRFFQSYPQDFTCMQD